MSGSRPSFRRLAIMAGVAASLGALIGSLWTVVEVTLLGDSDQRLVTAASLTVFMLSCAVSSWFFIYLVDARRNARRSTSILAYSRLAAHRTRRLVEHVGGMLNRPNPITADQLDQRIDRVSQAIERGNTEVSTTTKASIAVVLDDLDRADRHLETIRNRAEHIATIRSQTELLSNKVDSLSRTSDADLDRIAGRVERELADFSGRFYPVMEGLVATYFSTKPDTPLGSMRGWAISPDLAASLLTIVHRNRPGFILETGSGVSSVLFGMAIAHLGMGRVLALEHELRYLEATRAMVRDQGVEAFVDVVHAPLTSYDINGENYSWYDLAGVDLPESIDILFVDGPPGTIGQKARYPVLPLLQDRITDQTLILLDDVYRPDEASIVEAWADDVFPLDVEYLAHEKGTALITKSS